MVVLRCCNNNTVSAGNFIVKETQLETFVPFFILVEHWNIINFQNFQLKFNLKLTTDEFQKFAVI